MTISEICQAQRDFFKTGATQSVEYRIDALKKLQAAIRANEKEILSALKADLGKSGFEGYMAEIGMALDELSYMIRHVRALCKPRRVRTPLAQFPSRSYRLPKPYGNVLVMSPWNYPFMLTMSPLIDALAAGNTAVVKPSAYSPVVSHVIAELLSGCFSPEYVAVIEGGRAENAALLDEKFDYIFFTGSKGVGQLVMEKASRHLTSLTLELGGKSPCIVDETANIALAAKRIVFGKYLNVGQTCVAPDYVLVHESVKAALIDAVQAEIKRQFGENPLDNENYGKIVNMKHYERICGLIDAEKTIIGGGRDAAALRIEPTVLPEATMDSPVMQEEIFGPVMPVLSFKDIKEVPAIVDRHPTPLALYLFTEREETRRFIHTAIQFGGGCVNDTIIHLATTQMGFGGVGDSGMGSYHGKIGFDTFTHYASVVEKSTKFDLPVRYQPYSALKEKVLRMFMK